MRIAKEEDNIRFSIQVKMLKDEIKKKKKDVMMFKCRNDNNNFFLKKKKKGVRIAYRSGTVEKEVKMG